MRTRITGTTMPVLEIGLEAGEMIVAEPGEMSWMTTNIALRTTTATAGARGLWGAVARALGGGGLFMTEFTAQGGQGAVAFAAKLPGTIMQVDVQPGRGFMVHRHGFLCATQGVELGTGFQRSLGAGIFGGNGLVLQRIGGMCSAWVELGGEVVTYDLAAGEALQVHPGHVGMFEDSVTFDVTVIPGIANALFGGDGLFVARLTGPGRIWLQTLTVPNLAHALSPYLGREGGAVQATEGGVAGAVLGSLFGGQR
ncbi:MAG TPA: TIGR00266 family protein [Acetobacteraceae bacterium]|jgi:uncharacterized protein (TIGR00266 family)